MMRKEKQLKKLFSKKKKKWLEVDEWGGRKEREKEGMKKEMKLFKKEF